MERVNGGPEMEDGSRGTAGSFGDEGEDSRLKGGREGGEVMEKVKDEG